MIEELGSIEWDASQRSCIHYLDARVKILLVFLLIILVVAYPQSTGIIYIAIPFAGIPRLPVVALRAFVYHVSYKNRYNPCRLDFLSSFSRYFLKILSIRLLHRFLFLFLSFRYIMSQWNLHPYFS